MTQPVQQRRVLVSQAPWLTFGSFVAALVLVFDIVFLATNAIDLKVGLLIAGLCVAELLP